MQFAKSYYRNRKGGYFVTISERIFELLNEHGMTQKEFSEATGIPQSTISDWRKKNTNPASDKIMIICYVLQVTPTYLLSGVEPDGGRSREVEYLVIDKNSRDGILLEYYHDLATGEQERLLGYAQAMFEMKQRK